MVRFFKALISLTFILVLTFLLLEGSLAFLLRHPGLTHGLLRTALQQYYLEYDRENLAYSPECAQFDKELGYKLRPGECQQKEREFDVTYNINSAGFRDDAASLSPKVVVLGDSFALGWGVPQDKEFPERLQSKIGEPVLNTGVPSYGTARELASLADIDTSQLETLVIQYCQNDFDENQFAFNNPDHVTSITRPQYDFLTKVYGIANRYYIGKHTSMLLEILWNKLTNKVRPDAKENAAKVEEYKDEMGAKLFVALLSRLPDDLKEKQIIVFEVNGYANNDSGFVDALRKEKCLTDRPEWMKKIQVLDLSGQLTADKYYELDDHITAAGHEIIADDLAQAIKSRQRGVCKGL